MGGMFPILMPLLALKHFNSACHVGLLMAAFNLGGFIAPLWGKIADRYGIHRELLISSLIMTAITLTSFAFTNTFTVWLGLASIQGVSVFLAITLGNLFIVEIHPKIEWDQRIGWLQTFNSGGQVSGMLLAAALSKIDLSAGLLVAASLIALAVLPGFLTPRVSHEMIAYRPAIVSPKHRIQCNQNSSHLQFSQVQLNIFKHLHSARQTPFVPIMGIWFLCVAGVSAVYTLYPVMMQEAFGVAAPQHGQGGQPHVGEQPLGAAAGEIEDGLGLLGRRGRFRRCAVLLRRLLDRGFRLRAWEDPERTYQLQGKDWGSLYHRAVNDLFEWLRKKGSLELFRRFLRRVTWMVFVTRS